MVATMIAGSLLLAACSDDAEKPPAPAPTAASPAAVTAVPLAPSDTASSIPLRLAPEGLLGFPAAGPDAPPPPASASRVSATPLPPPPAVAPSASVSALPAPPQPQAPAVDEPPSEAEVQNLYAGIIYTYAFDACGLPLIGQTARQDIAHRIEVCPNPPVRKDAFRTVYQRAIEAAERDPEKMRATAAQACPDKAEFLRRVMSHADELRFDSRQPTDCGLLTPAAPAGPPNTQGTQPTPQGKSGRMADRREPDPL